MRHAFDMSAPNCWQVANHPIPMPAGYFAGLQNELSTWYDTTFQSGYFVHYDLPADQVIRINWGDETFQRSAEDEVYPGWAPSEVDHEWTYHIGFKHACGSPCWSHALFPKNENDPVRSYDYPLLCHPSKDILFYREYLNENCFTVENINTQKKIRIVPDNFPGFGFFLDGLDTFYFEKDHLIVTWKTELSFETHTETSTKRISLDPICATWEKAEDYVLSGVPAISADNAYFDSIVSITISNKKNGKQLHFKTSYSSYCDSALVDVLKYPGIHNVPEIVRVIFEVPTCCTSFRMHYFLVDRDGNLSALPALHYSHCDCPGPHEAYVFPNERFGDKGKILHMKLRQDEEECGKIKSAQVMKEIVLSP